MENFLKDTKNFLKIGDVVIIGEDKLGVVKMPKAFVKNLQIQTQVHNNVTMREYGEVIGDPIIRDFESMYPPLPALIGDNIIEFNSFLIVEVYGTARKSVYLVYGDEEVNGKRVKVWGTVKWIRSKNTIIFEGYVNGKHVVKGDLDGKLLQLIRNLVLEAIEDQQ